MSGDLTGFVPFNDLVRLESEKQYKDLDKGATIKVIVEGKLDTYSRNDKNFKLITDDKDRKGYDFDRESTLVKIIRPAKYPKFMSEIRQKERLHLYPPRSPGFVRDYHDMTPKRPVNTPRQRHSPTSRRIQSRHQMSPRPDSPKPDRHHKSPSSNSRRERGGKKTRHVTKKQRRQIKKSRIYF